VGIAVIEVKERDTSWMRKGGEKENKEGNK